MAKKYKTLLEDFEFLKKVVAATPAGNGTKHWNTLKKDDEKGLYIMKMRMTCRTTKKSNFRVIYLYSEPEQKITFIEIYFKSNKENENKKKGKESMGKYNA